MPIDADAMLAEGHKIRADKADAAQQRRDDIEAAETAINTAAAALATRLGDVRFDEIKFFDLRTNRSQGSRRGRDSGSSAPAQASNPAQQTVSRAAPVPQPAPVPAPQPADTTTVSDSVLVRAAERLLGEGKTGEEATEELARTVRSATMAEVVAAVQVAEGRVAS